MPHRRSASEAAGGTFRIRIPDCRIVRRRWILDSQRAICTGRSFVLPIGSFSGGTSIRHEVTRDGTSPGRQPDAGCLATSCGCSARIVSRPDRSLSAEPAERELSVPNGPVQFVAFDRLRVTHTATAADWSIEEEGSEIELSLGSDEMIRLLAALDDIRIGRGDYDRKRGAAAVDLVAVTSPVEVGSVRGNERLRIRMSSERTASRSAAVESEIPLHPGGERPKAGRFVRMAGGDVVLFGDIFAEGDRARRT